MKGAPPVGSVHPRSSPVCCAYLGLLADNAADLRDRILPRAPHRPGSSGAEHSIARGWTSSIIMKWLSAALVCSPAYFAGQAAADTPDVRPP